VTVPCPSMVRDYQRWMGGVDIHDQLRMQRYSLQLAVVLRKYYKTIFLVLVDMAIVNAFIVYREAQKKSGVPRADPAKFLQDLHAQMIELTAADFANQVRPSAGIGG
jgi:CDP-glycerol glycerophosphotransferase (TagB/SpsB family)